MVAGIPLVAMVLIFKPKEFDVFDTALLWVFWLPVLFQMISWGRK